jgi:hypothetical protein
MAEAEDDVPPAQAGGSGKSARAAIGGIGFAVLSAVEFLDRQTPS